MQKQNTITLSEAGRKAIEARAIAFELKEKKQKERAAKQFISKLEQHSGVPLRYRGLKLADYTLDTKESKIVYSRVKNYIKKFEELKQIGCSLVFCGRPGTGKTHLACSLANELIQTGERVLYTTVYKAISEVKSTYSKESGTTEAEVIKAFQEPALLILDEVGVQFGSEVEKMIFYQIINGRYESILPTLIISNLNNKNLSAFIGERTMDRLRECGGAVLAFEWGSFRAKNRRIKNRNNSESALKQFVKHNIDPFEIP